MLYTCPMPPLPPLRPPWQVLNAVTQASVAVLSVLWAAWDIYAVGATDRASPTDRAMEQLAGIRPHWIEMCYLGIFCTAVCGWLQVRMSHARGRWWPVVRPPFSSFPSFAAVDLPPVFFLSFFPVDPGARG